MTTETPSPAAPAPSAEPKPNSFARIFGALFSPIRTFDSVARRPDWVVPLLVIVLIGYATTFVMMPRIDWDSMRAAQAEQMKARNPNMSQEDIDRFSRMGPAMGKVFGWIAPVIGVIWYLVVALVLWLAFRLFGGEGGFKQAFSATLYAWMPLVLYGIVATIVAAARGGLVDLMQMPTMVKSNLAFLTDIKAQPLLFALLAGIDVFTIWTVVLLIIGFAALSRTSRAKAAAIVIPLWVVCLLIRLIGPAIQSLKK